MEQITAMRERFNAITPNKSWIAYDDSVLLTLVEINNKLIELGIKDMEQWINKQVKITWCDGLEEDVVMLRAIDKELGFILLEDIAGRLRWLTLRLIVFIDLVK
jgi:hypothetical protein